MSDKNSLRTKVVINDDRLKYFDEISKDKKISCTFVPKSFDNHSIHGV